MGLVARSYMVLKWNVGSATGYATKVWCAITLDSWGYGAANNDQVRFNIRGNALLTGVNKPRTYTGVFTLPSNATLGTKADPEGGGAAAQATYEYIQGAMGYGVGRYVNTAHTVKVIAPEASASVLCFWVGGEPVKYFDPLGNLTFIPFQLMELAT